MFCVTTTRSATTASTTMATDWSTRSRPVNRRTGRPARALWPTDWWAALAPATVPACSISPGNQALAPPPPRLAELGDSCGARSDSRMTRVAADRARPDTERPASGRRARARHEGISFLIVERGPGVASTPLEKLGWHASDTALISFEDVFVPAENLLGAENAGLKEILGRSLGL